MTGIKKYAVIVAGGSGLRMGSDLPKQFIPLAGKPVLMHTLEQFHNFDDSISLLLVLPKLHMDYWKELVKQYNFSLKHRLVEGGKERFFSVKNAIDTIEAPGLVAIHDGVRPLVSKQTIANCFSTAAKYGTAVPTMPLSESLRKIDAENSVALDRSLYHSVQTPQVFDVSLIKEAYGQDFQDTFTDDASVIEKLGKKIYLCEGNAENIKLTLPMDLKLAEILLEN